MPMKAQVALIASAKERTKDAMIALVMRLEDEGAIDIVSAAPTTTAPSSARLAHGTSTQSRPRASTGAGASVLEGAAALSGEELSAAALFAKDASVTPSGGAGAKPHCVESHPHLHRTHTCTHSH